MPETEILGPPTLPPPKQLTEGRETQDLAGGEGGKESSPPDSPLFYCRGERGERKRLLVTLNLRIFMLGNQRRKVSFR
jgi:hypothetical protein